MAIERKRFFEIIKNDQVNPLLKSKNKTPKDMVGDASNKNTLVEMLETAEKNYSPKKAKDLNVKIEGGGCYHLAQNDHKTQASLTANVGNVTFCARKCYRSYLERRNSIDESVSSYSSLESEQSETKSIRELENKLKKSQENIAAVVDFSSKPERELNDQLNRLAQEKKDLESEIERLSKEANQLKRQQTNAQQQLDDTLEKLSNRDGRI
ncbi:hypothetical protein IHO40_04480 [Wolbachia endosymbiont of Mansonella ozzardi]|uniref:coiled-coil domain-containing protein n=1 Tax=Wolbachia endosymbiont of Mansonella ozzardi TaxID=137464 RepID=UPI001CE19951|nr:hypothetical protein [Wolbachia endosymbiont of Mansonella ozzardi]MCA4775332.1 hypothetical protein [Wolbachia endosymbiont of Mansonella ozzardi]